MKRMIWVFVSPLPIVIWALLPEFGITVKEPWFTIFLVIFIALPFVTSLLLFAPAMFSFFGGSPGTRRILANGRSADGVIKSIGESSLGGVITVNNQPYLNLLLEVHDSYQAPYIVSLDTIIPRTAVPQFQPGAIIPIKIDPNDPMKVAINWGRD